MTLKTHFCQSIVTRRVKLFLAALVLLLVGVAYLGLRVAPAKAARQKLDAIKASGLPSSPAELDRWYKRIPPEVNRAVLFLEASRELVTVSADLFDTPITPDRDKKLADYLAKNKGAFSRLRHATELPESRFPVDLSRGLATTVGHFAPMKSLAQAAKVNAIYQARHGNTEEACRSILDILSVARALRNEPLYISGIVGMSVVGVAVETAERVVNDAALNDHQLAQLSSSFAQAEAEGRESLVRGLVGERAVGIAAFDSSFTQFDALSGGAMPTTKASPSIWFRSLAFQAYRVSGLRERDLELYLGTLERFIDSVRSPFPDALRQCAEAQKRMEDRFLSGLGRFAIFSRLLLPALSNGLRKEAALSAKLRCLQIALAVERFKIESNGAVPTTPASLCPQYLNKIPVDPFDSGPFVFEVLGKDGYRIASSGATADRRRTVAKAEEVAIVIRRAPHKQIEEPK